MYLQDFFSQYNGRGVDFDGYYGDQCVDLVQFYNRDVVHAPILTGNAVDVWNTYPKNSYVAVANSPTNFPSPGDIVIWNRNMGNGNGHIAIVSDANTNNFTSLDQNWTPGSPSQFVHHDYTNVIGWLHPNTPVIAPAPTPVPNPTPTPMDINGAKATRFDQMLTVLYKAGFLPNDASGNYLNSTTAVDALNRLATDRLNQSQRAGKWDQLCIKAGITTDSNQVTVDQLVSKLSPVKDYRPLLTQIKSMITQEGI